MSRFILITEFFPPEIGGIQTSLELIAPVFGSELTVIAPPQRGDDDFDRRQPYQTIRRSLFSGPGWPSWQWLVPWLWSRRRQAELVLFGHFSGAVLAGWLSRWFGLRYAILVYGRDLLTEQRRWPLRWFMGTVLRSATWIGVISDFTAGLVRQYRVPENKLVLTHPAVPEELTVKVPSTRNDPQLVTVCRLVTRKNVATVIRAVAKLRSEIPALEYHIIGDGPERGALERLRQEMKLSSQVTFHGWVSEPEKIRLLQASTIGVLVPRVLEAGSDVEGLGIFYLEAAACGLPLVASATGGVTDIADDEKTALVTDPEDIDSLVKSIRRLIIDPALSARLGQAGQELVRREFTVPVRNRRVEALVQGWHMSNPPLVSIIIPAFQAAKTIGRTITSVLKQTWPHWELIVVDDGSTDQLTQALAPHRSQIQFIHQTNQGAPLARNRGAAAAQGQFLLFLDADTWLHPQALTAMIVALLTHPSVSYAYSNFRFGPKMFRLFDFNRARLRQMNYIHTTSLIRRADFPGFDPALRRFQDWDVWLTLLRSGQHGIWVPTELFRVQQQRGGMSTWLPSFVYRLPWIGRGRGSDTIRRYRQAELMIRRKHHLD